MDTNQKIKSYLNTIDLISKLKEKGVIVENETEAEAILNSVGYYKLINSYRNVFQIEDVDQNLKLKTFSYLPETRFNDIYNLYCFDFDLRLLSFSYILKIETCFKNILSNYASESFGCNYEKFLNSENFKDEFSVNLNEIKEKIANIIEKAIKSKNKNYYGGNNSLIHYIENYSAIPTWVLFNYLTIGEISNLYSMLKDENKKYVAEYFKLTSYDLEAFLKNLVLFRNVCAHGERLYNFRTLNKLKHNPIKSIYEDLNIFKSDKGYYTKGTSDYLSLMIILKILLTKNEFKEYLFAFKKLLADFEKKMNQDIFNKIKYVMGLVGNWENLDNIELKMS